MKEYEVRCDLPGWEIFFADLESKPTGPAQRTVLVYLPEGVVGAAHVEATLTRLLSKAPVG